MTASATILTHFRHTKQHDMKHFIAIALLTCCICQLPAQNDMRPVSDVAVLSNRIAQGLQKLTSLTCDFKQTKHSDMLDQDIVSEGKFYYKKENKLRMDYHRPVQYRLVVNGDKIGISQNGKTNVYPIGRNKVMREINRLITACMTGNLHAMQPTYDLHYFENSQTYLIKAHPLHTTIKNMLTEIHIYLDKQDLSVVRLKLLESSTGIESNYTEYSFTNRQPNSTVSDAYFTLK